MDTRLGEEMPGCCLPSVRTVESLGMADPPWEGPLGFIIEQAVGIWAQLLIFHRKHFPISLRAGLWG